MADFNLQQTNERSLEIMADIIEPYFRLMKDKEFTKLYMTNVVEAIKYACREHQAEVIEIAAVLNGKKVDEYVVDPFKLPLTLLTAIGTYSKLNSGLFTSQAQNSDEASSGSAMENIGAEDQPSNS